MTDDVVERGAEAALKALACADMAGEDLGRHIAASVYATLKPGDVFGDHYVETVHEGMIFARQAAADMREACAKAADVLAEELDDSPGLKHIAIQLGRRIRALPLPGESASPTITIEKDSTAPDVDIDPENEIIFSTTISLDKVARQAATEEREAIIKLIHDGAWEEADMLEDLIRSRSLPGDKE